MLSVIATKAHDFAVLECAKSDDIARTSWMCPKTQVLGSLYKWGQPCDSMPVSLLTAIINKRGGKTAGSTARLAPNDEGWAS